MDEQNTAPPNFPAYTLVNDELTEVKTEQEITVHGAQEAMAVDTAEGEITVKQEPNDGTPEGSMTPWPEINTITTVDQRRIEENLKALDATPATKTTEEDSCYICTRNSGALADTTHTHLIQRRPVRNATCMQLQSMHRTIQGSLGERASKDT